MKVLFEKHQGILNIDDNTVEFYNIQFPTMVEATKFLSNVEAGPEYRTWYFRRHKGLQNPDDDWVYVDHKWFCDEEMAEDHIKNKLKYSR